MIKKNSSAELMQILENSQKSIEKAHTDISIISDNLQKELMVVRNIQDFNMKQMEIIKESVENRKDNGYNNKIMFASDSIVAGDYSIYGNTVHPAIIREISNVFNFGTAKGKYFKNNANVYVDEEPDETFKNALMDDEITTKGIAFKEFNKNIFMLTVEVNPDALMGSTEFNTIELDPYIPGSFEIKDINVYTMEDYRSGNIISTLAYFMMMDSAGKIRIILDKSYALYKCEITIELKHRVEISNVYPFGLKHLYFLKNSYNTESYVIAKIQRDKYIETISEDIHLRGQNGMQDSTCTDEGIRLFQSYEGGTLIGEISTSKGVNQNPLTKNLKEFYAYIPIGCSLMSMQFDNISEK